MNNKFLIIIYSLLVLYSCKKEKTSIDNNFETEIIGLEKTNENYIAHNNIFKNHFPIEFQENSKIFKQIAAFKKITKENKLLKKAQIQSLKSSIENELWTPDEFFTILEKEIDNPKVQYKYLLLIENSVYQNIYIEAPSSYLHFDLIAPFVRTDKFEYNINDSIYVTVGYNAINTKNPYKVLFDNKEYLIDNYENKINLKATKKGLNEMTGEIIQSNGTRSPFILRFQVN